MKREHAERLTKAQLVDELVSVRRREIDAEAEAFHACVRALDRLRPTTRNGYVGSAVASAQDPSVTRVLEYLLTRYGINHALKGEVERLHADLAREREAHGQLVRDISMTVEGERTRGWS